jgi:hypothetical protein
MQSDVSCRHDCYFSPFKPSLKPSCENCLKSECHGGKVRRRRGAGLATLIPRARCSGNWEGERGAAP